MSIVSQLLERLGRRRWLHSVVAALRVYPTAGLVLRHFPLYRRLKPSGLVYRLTSLDQLSVEYGMFRVEEYAPALLNHEVESLIDLGCNAGWFALWLTANGRSRKGPGLLIDAHPRMAEEALWHMNRNGLINCAVVHGAVGLPPGTSSTNFHIHPSSVASSVMQHQAAMQYPVKGRIVESIVPAVSVTSEWQLRFADTIVDLMKIDIEGKELDFVVYEGGFIRRSVRRLIVEWHKWSVALSQLDSHLVSIGFQRRGVYGETEMLGVALYENVN